MTQTTFQMKHILSPDNISTLVNGGYYNAELCVYDSDDTVSPFSDKIVFYCFTTPNLVFSNLTAGQVIMNSHFKVTMTYSQPETELLNSYHITLYNARQEVIRSSSEIFNTTLLEYTLSGLESNTQYYVQATGVTINQMTVNTGIVPFSVRYKQPSTFGVVNLENNPLSAQIKIISNIKSILGRSIPEDILYIENEKVDLREQNTQVIFDDNFNIRNDFCLKLYAQDVNEQSVILKAVSKDGGSFYIRNKILKVVTLGDELQYYFDVVATNGVVNYVTSSNYIPVPKPDDYIRIVLKKQSDVYEMRITNLGSERSAVVNDISE